MNIDIKQGTRKPALNWLLFSFKFLVLTLAGFFSLPMSIWAYTKYPVYHRILGKKSYFSKNGCALIACPDNHPGRFKIYATVIDGDTNIMEFICYVYNDRKYSFSLERRLNSWIVSVDGRYMALETKGVPVFTYNLLPHLSGKLEITEDVDIIIND